MSDQITELKKDIAKIQEVVESTKREVAKMEKLLTEKKRELCQEIYGKIGETVIIKTSFGDIKATIEYYDDSIFTDIPFAVVRMTMPFTGERLVSISNPADIKKCP